MTDELVDDTFQVYVAKFTYDPVTLSPNDNPDLELSFQAGDYLFVYGQLDEDGFYDGELMDGRKGLVPSNYIDKVSEEELKELDKPSTNGLGYENVDVRDSPEVVTITEVIDNIDGVPPPKDLHLERQLSNSFVVAWQPAEESILLSEGINLDSYLVSCNDQPVTSVLIGERTKTLLEKLDVNKSHRVSVRAVATDRRQSCEQLCTITVGKKARLAPSAVEVTQIAKRSANVQWCLASSYLQHRVSVDDDRWVHILPAGVFKCIISGLQPNSSHTVSISCIQATSVDENCFVSSSVSFVTLPRDFPDPPTDVQAEIGPQKGTILVTWKPAAKEPGSMDVTKSMKKTNITGYTVYISGKKARHISNPYCDHLVLNWKNHDFEDQTTYNLSVRTTTDRWESPDSSPPTCLGIQLIQEVIRGRPAVFESEEALKKDDDFIVGYKCEQQDYYNKSNFNSKNDLLQKLTDKGVKKELFSQYNTDQYETQPTRIAGRLRNKKVQTSPILMRLIDRDPNVDYYDKATTMTLRKKHDISVGNDDDIYNNIPTIITTPATLNRSLKSDARNIALGEEDSILGSDLEKGDVSKVRLFVGLFDYNPSTMSPNPECSNEELQFSQGQLLKVYGDKDADGFYMGESNCMKGLIPSNMVSEVLVYNPLTAEQLLKDNLALCKTKQTNTNSLGRLNNGQKKLPQLPYLKYHRDGHRQGLNTNRPRRMVVVHNYSPDKNQPDADTEFELCLKQGNRVVVFGDPDQDGFIKAELNQKKGYVPINHLRPATPVLRMPGQKIRGRSSTQGRSLPSQQQYSSRRSYSVAPLGYQSYNTNDLNQFSKQGNWEMNSSMDNPTNDYTTNAPNQMAPTQPQFAQQCNPETYMYQG